MSPPCLQDGLSSGSGASLACAGMSGLLHLPACGAACCGAQPSPLRQPACCSTLFGRQPARCRRSPRPGRPAQWPLLLDTETDAYSSRSWCVHDETQRLHSTAARKSARVQWMRSSGSLPAAARAQTTLNGSGTAPALACAGARRQTHCMRARLRLRPRRCCVRSSCASLTPNRPARRLSPRSLRRLPSRRPPPPPRCRTSNTSRASALRGARPL